VYRVAFGSDGRIFAAFIRREQDSISKPADSGVVVFDPDGKRAKPGILTVPKGEITTVAVGNEGHIAIAYALHRFSQTGGGIIIFDPDGMQTTAEPLAVPEGKVESLAFGPGERLAAGFSRTVQANQQGGVVVFDTNGARTQPGILAVPEGGVNCVAFGSDGRIAAGFVVGVESEGVVVFNSDGSRASPGILHVPEGQVTCVGFASNSRIVAGFSRRVSGGGALTNEGGLIVFDPIGARLVSVSLAVPDGLVSGMTFGPNERVAAGVSRRLDGKRQGGVMLFDTSKAVTKPRILPVPEGSVHDLAVGSDGRVFAAFSRREPDSYLKLADSGVVVFDPDGKRARPGILRVPNGEIASIDVGSEGYIAIGYTTHAGSGGVAVFDAEGNPAPPRTSPFLMAESSVSPLAPVTASQSALVLATARAA
jgi:hypothetical protein